MIITRYQINDAKNKVKKYFEKEKNKKINLNYIKLLVL